MFSKREIEKWNIKETIEDYNKLLTDFKYAKQFIIPEESIIRDDIMKQTLFINKHVLYEFTNFHKNSDYYLKDNFIDFCEKVKKNQKAKNILWNILSTDDKGILKIDYTFPMKASK